ncbi:hypothetical protein IAR50_004442 [Cryptococcus sp. DSM 104548]
MRPRIPARLSGELIQLGVLLPWAARASSSTAVLREEDGQRRGRGGSAAKRRLLLYPVVSGERNTRDQAQKSNIMPERDEFFVGETSSTAQTTRAGAASRNNEESPKSSFIAPSENGSSAEASGSLSRMAKAAYPPTIVHHLLSKPCPPPPSQIFAHLPSSPSDLNQVSGELLISYSARMGDYKTQKSTIDLLVRRRLVPLGYKKQMKIRDREKIKTGKKGVWEMRGNEWALRKWAPIESLEDESKYTTLQLLGRLHHLLLYGEAPSLEFALRLLRNAIDHPTDSPSPKGKERERETGELDVLNLYLAYAPWSAPADSLLSTVSSFSPSTKPNQQSLHLSILSLCSPPSPATQAHQVTQKQILAMLKKFTSMGVLPGLETWRHIAKFATKFGIRDLGRVGWEGWFGTLRYAEARSLLGPLSCPPEPRSSEEFGDGPGRCTIKFAHIGVHRTRWARILEKMEKKGWVQKSEAGERRWGYVWKDADAEEPVAGQLTEEKMQEPGEKKGMVECGEEKGGNKAVKGDVRKPAPHQRDLRTVLLRPRSPSSPRVSQVAQRHIQSLGPHPPSPPPSS